MSTPQAAPGPSVPPSAPAVQPSSNVAQAAIFIGLSVGVVIICALVLWLALWLFWRKNRREVERLQRLQQEQEPAEPSVKKQVRLPVLVVNPGDDDVSYGRKESRFFPAMPPPTLVGEPAKEPELPHTPPPGAYYIESKLPSTSPAQ